MKIIFIPNLPYTYRDHERFGVKYFLDKGYDVEVMDVHKILLPKYKEQVDIEYYTFSKHWEPNNVDEIISSVKQLSSEDFLFFYINSYEGMKLLNQMKDNTRAKFITYVGGSIPTSTVFCNKVKKIKALLKPLVKKYLPKYRAMRFETDIFVSGSPKDELIFPYLIDKNTQLIKSNSRDYNLCLNSKPYQNSKPYCVFLDTDVIDASDYILFGNNIQKDIDQYMNKLIKFFKWIEEEYNIEVIIAAHPKSRIYKDKNEIDGIKIEHGKSVELVQGCEFVINEGTTAISYAVYFEKPSVFFTFKEIDFFYEHCCSFTKALKKEIINIDHLDIDLFKEELLNKNYKDYKYQYLTYNDDKIYTFDKIETFLKRVK
ncbi:hypothetical protein [Sulfurimonas sp. HSL3-2]|uniref:hypothetical protein n=1 Tax=Hydrocurvibacter mobilis TaxID=3131936 RepID=UPI0031F7985C